MAIDNYLQGELARVGYVQFVRGAPAFHPLANYVIGDYVTSAGKLYVARATSIGMEPEDAPDYWAEDTGAIDPDTVTFHYTPEGQAEVVQTYSALSGPIKRVGVGLYYTMVDTTSSYGLYTGYWKSTGAGQAVLAWAIRVVPLVPVIDTPTSSVSGNAIRIQGIPVATGPADGQIMEYNAAQNRILWVDPFSLLAEIGMSLWLLKLTVDAGMLLSGAPVVLSLPWVPTTVMSYISGGTAFSDQTLIDGLTPQVTVLLTDPVLVAGNQIVIMVTK